MLYLGVMLIGFALSLATISSVWLIDLNEQEFSNTLQELPAYTIGCFAIFYILQKRELKSFLRERTAIVKQEQVEEIFNA